MGCKRRRDAKKQKERKEVRDDKEGVEQLRRVSRRKVCGGQWRRWKGKEVKTWIGKVCPTAEANQKGWGRSGRGGEGRLGIREGVGIPKGRIGRREGKR